MIIKLSAALLALAVTSVTASPVGEEWNTPADNVAIGVPRMIPPKYRSNAKRAIIRYKPFTLAAKGVSHSEAS
jgi:hypothetical protein